MRWKAACVGMTLLAACGGAAPESGDQQDERFVGRWFIEETEAHALYSASTYAFAADGTLSLVWDAGLYGFPQGYVRSPDGALSCFFGDTWSSRGQELLVIDGACDDDSTRAITLRFTSAPSSNVAGAAVQIDSVGGQAGWLPPQWGWSFRKCAPEDPCTGTGP